MKKIIHQLIFPKEINLIFLSVFLFAASLGINVVTFPTVLSNNGINSAQIGLAASLDIFAGILASFFLSKIVARFGVIRTMFTSSTFYGLAVLIIYFYQSYYLWLIFCLLMGAAFFSFIITRQAWLNSLFTADQRSIGIGIFSLTISSGLSLGPIIVSFLGADNYSSFLVSAALTFLSFQAVARIKVDSSIKIASSRIKLITFYKHNPRCCLGRLLLEFQFFFILIFTVIFGKNIGLSPEKAGLLISAYLITGLFDVYVGFLLKKHDPYKLIHISFLSSLALISIMSIYHYNFIFLLVIYFLLGICTALAYVSLFTIVNHDYPKEKLVAANSTFQVVGYSGALMSTLFGGSLVNILGTYGYTLTLAFASFFYLFFLVIREKKQ